MKMMTVGAMGIQSAEVIARQEEADSVDRQELQSGIYPRAGGRRVRKGARCSALLRAIVYCTILYIGAAHEGGERKKWIRWTWRGIGTSLIHTQLQGERERAAWPWCAQL